MLNTVQIFRKNTNTAEETKQASKLELIRISEIDPKSVEWLWHSFIPYNKVSLVQGNPGDGKITMDIYAKVKYNRSKELSAVVNGAFHKEN